MPTIDHYGMSGRLEAYDERNDLGVVLDATASYLLEGIYGAYHTTASDHARRIVSAVAITTVASAVMPMPVTFTATSDDIPAMRLLQMAAIIQPCPAVMSVGDGTVPISLSASVRDAMTMGTSSSAAPSPPIIRDAAGIRGRIIEASAVHSDEFDGCATPRDVVGTLGRLAGRPWSTACEWLLSGGPFGEAA